MYKNLLFLLFIILLNSGLLAQDWNEIYLLEGEAQYMLEEKDYENAIDIYRRMLKEVPEHSFAKYKIGLLYLLTDDQKDMAIGYLEEASQNIALDFNAKSLREIRTPIDVLLYLGKAYQMFGRIDEAILVYNNLKDIISQEHELYPITMQRLATCENAKAVIQNPKLVKFENLGQPLNTDKSNFNAVVSGDGNTMIYTAYTRNYIDIFASVKENGVWGQPKKITDKVSGKYYLKTTCLSYDGTELYLATDDSEENDIYVSVKEGRSWVGTYKLDKTISGKKSNETSACISKDGNALYFTSDREGGLGGLDIYKSIKDAKGKWGEPINLGSTINTPFDEETPYVTQDGEYIFFSSEGHNSIGGFDVFYASLSGSATPKNLGYPANTMGDDLFFIPDNSLNKGFISRYDSTSVGKNDVYYLSILPQIQLAGVLKNKENSEQITDADLSVSLVDVSSGSSLSGDGVMNGKFTYYLGPGSYMLAVNGTNYESFTQEITIPEGYNEENYIFEALLNPVKQEEPELLADVVEVPEPIVEETPIEPVVQEAEPEPEPEKVVEEPKQEPVEVKKEVIEKSKKPEPKKTIKYEIHNSIGDGVKTYSVQLMALRVPVEVNYFKDIDGVELKKYEDGFYRYTVGLFTSYSKAQNLKKEIHALGYTDAYVRINNSVPKFTIQIMALIIPVKPDYFNDLSAVAVTKGADDYFRYTVGNFGSYSEAKQELSKIAELGYPGAYIKRTN
jgi:cell division septation protein DedD